MDSQILIFVLLLAGVALIFAELFLPSGGAIAVICVCCILGSIYFAYKAWYGSHNVYWWVYLGSVALLIPATVIGAFQILTRTPLGNRVLLPAPTADEVTPYQQEQQRLEALIGKRGTALNLMTPGGLVKVDGERLHAVSDGLVIDPGSEIEIVAVSGTRVIVRPVEPGEPEPEKPVAFDEPPDDVDPWMEDS